MFNKFAKAGFAGTVKKLSASALVFGLVAAPLTTASAQDAVKIGFMLPYTGTYAQLGEAITNGVKLAIEEQGGKLGGRDVQYVTVDSEADPGKAVGNMQKLVSGEKVDFVIGPVHSGVAMAMLKTARQEGTMLLIPNAGLDVATRQLCAPNVFRTSFSNWQPGFAMGKAAAEKGHKNVVTMTWRYGAGQESVAGFKEGFEKAGGKVSKEIFVPFPDVEFQAQLTEIANLNPDAVYVFFAGGGAVKFVKDYAAAGLKGKIPLIGAGFLTDGTLQAQGQAAEGVQTALHYSENLDNPANKKFQESYKAKYGKAGDVYAVQGYDTGTLLVKGLEAVKGNTKDQKALVKAMENVKFDNSPRGEWEFSKAHNPVQDMYLREVRNGENIVVGVAAEDLSDPATGCQMK